MIIGGIFGVIIVANMMSEVASRMVKHVFKIISIDPIDVHYIWIEIWIRARNRARKGEKIVSGEMIAFTSKMHTQTQINGMSNETKLEQDVFQRC